MLKNTSKKIAVLGLTATMCGTQGLVANAQYSGPRYRINEASYLDITCPCEVEHTVPGGSLRVTGNTMVSGFENEGQAARNVTVNNANFLTPASSITMNLQNGTIFDIGATAVSGFENEGQAARNVTVNNANFLTPASSITMNLQNGTIFDIGATAQETQEELQTSN